MRKPILFLMFDIGVKAIQSPLVKVSYSEDNTTPQVWAVHSRGHTDKTFGCLRAMDCSGNSAAFFASVTEKVGLYADIAKVMMMMMNSIRHSVGFAADMRP